MTRRIPERQVEEFQVNQNIIYNFNQNGVAQVEYNIELTNSTALIYAKEYTLRFEGSVPENIESYDEAGTIPSTFSESSIALAFKKPAIGKDNSKKFTIKFNVGDLVKNNGSLKELTLPSIQNPFQTNTTIKLVVPESWGQLAHQSIDTQELSFTSTSKLIPKTNFSFGNAQIVDFKLNYYLDSGNQIPLPPDSSNQQVLFKKISPMPIAITQDQDGNWYANYKHTNPIDIVVEGSAKLGQNIYYKDNSTLDYLKKTLEANDTWPKLSEKYSSPRQIYDHVVSTLDYNRTRASAPENQTVLQLLDNPQNAICTDFTNYFISLARSNNISSRQIIGYALTNNQEIRPLNQNADILHTWPQFFDTQKNTWHEVDPTWGKTTGVDYYTNIGQNHLAFIIRGTESTYPKPPGAFRQPGSPKSVEVNYANHPFTPTQNPLVHEVSYNLFNQTVLTKNPNLNTFATMAPLAQTSKNLPLAFFQTYDNQVFYNYRLIGVAAFTTLLVILTIILAIIHIKQK